MPDRRSSTAGVRRRILADGHPAIPLLERPLAAVLSGRKILIAEDEIIIAMEVQGALEDAGGCIVGPAHTLNDALQLAESADINAAVLDLRLGSRSADGVAAILSKRGVPFIFYSGQTATDPDRVKWPHVATVSKPASGRALVKAVATLLEQDIQTPS